MLVACCSSTSYLFTLPIRLNSLDREGVRLLSPRDSQILPKPVCRCRCNRVSDATELKEEFDEDIVRSVVSFQLISSGAQLERSGICVAFGVVFFYFGSVVRPWLYLDDVMLCSCIVWCGDCKPTMYPFSLMYYMGGVTITSLATLLSMRLCL